MGWVLVLAWYCLRFDANCVSELELGVFIRIRAKDLRLMTNDKFSMNEQQIVRNDGLSVQLYLSVV